MRRLANLGNLIYAVYVVSLPIGPVWALHGFHLGATGLMLFWYLRHAGRHRARDKTFVETTGSEGLGAQFVKRWRTRMEDLFTPPSPNAR
jgi:hypothetical protein